MVLFGNPNSNIIRCFYCLQLFLSTFVTGGLLGPVVERLSENFLGNEEILLETFEFLHTAFFDIGVGFFIVAGLTVADAVYEVNKLSNISKLALDTGMSGKFLNEWRVFSMLLNRNISPFPCIS